MVMPEIRLIEVEGNYGKLSIEPLQRGYGITIGNPLRRILISSIPGSAITWVKIDNVVHEYTAIEGVKEEVMRMRRKGFPMVGTSSLGRKTSNPPISTKTGSRGFPKGRFPAGYR